MYLLEIIRKNIILISILVLLSFTIILTSLIPKTYAAVDCTGQTGVNSSKCEACRGSGGASYTGGKCVNDSGEDPSNSVTKIVNTIITVFSWIVGVTSVIMIMIGGFRYVTSQGDSNNISAAKNTILYAIIGLVIVAFAQILVNFVIGKL